MKFSDLIRRDGESVSAITAALERAARTTSDAIARIEGLNEERTRALLADDEPELDRIERALVLAARDRDRGSLATSELNRRLALAQQRERDARLDAVHADGLEAQAQAVELIQGRYAEAAAEIVAIVTELLRLDERIAAANARLRAEGDTRQVATPDEVARPQGPDGLRLLPVPIPAALRLPDPDDATRTAWPPGRAVVDADTVIPQMPVPTPRAA